MRIRCKTKLKATNTSTKDAQPPDYRFISELSDGVFFMMRSYRKKSHNLICELHEPMLAVALESELRFKTKIWSLHK